MKLILRFLAASIILLFIGCVTTPKETVKLSEIVDQQIAEMHASHGRFVHLYYLKLRDEIDNFMHQTWIPNFLSNIIEGKGEGGKKFRADLDRAYKLSNLDWESAVEINRIDEEEIKEALRNAIRHLSTENNAMLGMVLLDFSKEVQEQIKKQRMTLIQPIDEQEAYVIDQLRDGYADLLRASAAIKGYLASTVKLVEDRDAVLEKMGILENQRKIVKTALNLNDGAVQALKATKKADEGITIFLETMKKTKDYLDKLKEGEA